MRTKQFFFIDSSRSDPLVLYLYPRKPNCDLCKYSACHEPHHEYHSLSDKPSSSSVKTTELTSLPPCFSLHLLHLVELLHSRKQSLCPVTLLPFCSFFSPPFIYLFFLLPLKSQARITSKSKHTLPTSRSLLNTQTAQTQKWHTKTHTLCAVGMVPWLAGVNGVEQVSAAAI